MNIDDAVTAGTGEAPAVLELAVDGDHAAGRGEQTRENLAEGRFAPAVFTDQRVHRAGLNPEIEVAQYRFARNGIGDVPEFDKERRLEEVVYSGHTRPLFYAWRSCCRVSAG